MSDVILDASALLAALNEETGSDAVELALPGAVIGAVNLSEVLAKLAEVGLSEADAWSAVSGLALRVVEFDEDLARIAGSLRPVTRALGLSFGDRACLALGRKLGLPVLTADRSWTRLDIGVNVQAIR